MNVQNKDIFVHIFLTLKGSKQTGKTNGNTNKQTLKRQELKLISKLKLRPNLAFIMNTKTLLPPVNKFSNFMLHQ